MIQTAKKTKEVQKVLQYLTEISGHKTVIGIHNKEPNAKPSLQTDEVAKLTGKTPGLYSADFLFLKEDRDARWKIVKECEKQWKQGAIVQLMLHVVAPTLTEPDLWEGGVVAHLSEEEWTDLVTEGGQLNAIWKTRLNEYAVYFKYLQESKVPVLFRPFHEMNQGAFWWGGRKGDSGTKKLFQLTRDYLEDHHGLDNLIFVWNIQDLDYEWKQYKPDPDYFEIFSLDVYNEDRYTQEKYDLMLQIADGKPIAIGECDVLPSPALLKQQPQWCFVMSWAELTFEQNSKEEILALYHGDTSVTLDDMNLNQ